MARRYTEWYPGVDCSISVADLSLEVSIRGVRDWSFRLEDTELKARSFTAGLGIRLRQPTETLRLIADLVASHLPFAEGVRRIAAGLPVVAIAGDDFNAAASSEGIISIETRFLDSLGILCMCFVVMTETEFAAIPTERTLQILRAVGYALRSVHEPSVKTWAPVQSRALDDLVHHHDAICRSKPWIQNELMPGLTTRFLGFVVAHEFAHVLLKHYEFKTLLLPDTDESVDRQFLQELEADLVAAQTTTSIMSAGGLPSGVVGQQIAFMFGAALLHRSARFGTARELLSCFSRGDRSVLGRTAIRGHPDWQFRAQLLLDTFGKEGCTHADAVVIHALWLLQYVAENELGVVE